MQARGRSNISPETVETLLDCVSDPRRLGGPERSFGIVRRSPYGEAFKAFFGRDLQTYRDLRDLFSSMLEEEAAFLMRLLGARMPDTSLNTVHETVRRLSEAV